MGAMEAEERMGGEESGVELAENRYGKAKVKLVKVLRGPEGNTLFDWTVRVLLRGDFKSAHTVGDNSKILATDTMKNTVYSVARQSSARTTEAFATELVEFLLGRNPQVDSVEVQVESALWKRLTVDGVAHPTTFMKGSGERGTTRVEQARNGRLRVVSGLADMVVLKTADSGFSGFMRDKLTTLAETEDRLMGTSVTATWEYVTNVVAYDEVRGRVRETMLRVFAWHKSRSVQETLYAMAEAALGAVREIDAIDLTLPNLHYIPVDLSRFGQENPNEIFVPMPDPHGYIEARVRRKVRG